MTKSPAAVIFETLAPMFAELDSKMVRDQKEWAKGRRVAIAAYKAETDRRAVGEWKYYAGLHAVAGGKTWSQILNGSEAAVADFVEKNCAAIADKRNANIARKLADAGVVEVTSSETVWTKDGFDGTFKVATDKGAKVVTIRTIYAGGYNIQCFHQRTLVRVR